MVVDKDTKVTKKQTYPNIDMQRTGSKLKYMFEAAGYTPRMIQDYLHLSCVQPIYRWYKGLILPSVDHLLMLRELLHVHMEELLVKKSAEFYACDIMRQDLQLIQRRLSTYNNNIYQSVA